MTDVNMDEPLPAIDIAECLAKAVPVMLNDEDGAEPDDWHLMTLSHLVQVLAALTETQRHEAIGQALGLGSEETFDGAGEELESLLSARSSNRTYREAAYSAIDRADQEKARADRAEQIIGQLQAGGMKLELERADRAEAVVEEAVAYQSEGPRCLFCSRGTETHVVSWHAADCALVSAGYVTREGERTESKSG
jgi:hypothetical protein